MNSQEKPTQAEVVAAILKGDGDQQVTAVYRQISARLEIYTLAHIDAMAQHSAKSRNDMVNMILTAGLEAITEKLPSELQTQLNLAAGKVLSGLLAQE